MAEKKQFSNLEEHEHRLEKIGAPLALGVVITLLVIIMIVMVIKLQGRNTDGDQESVETTQDLGKFDLADSSSQLEGNGTSMFPLVSDNDLTFGNQGTQENSTAEDYPILPSGLTGESSVSLYNKEFLDAEEYSLIRELLQSYFTAYENCDLSGIMKLVDFNGGVALTMDELTSKAEIVEGYQDLQCYIIEGMDANSYVVYASYDIKFYNIDTPAPTLTRFYVVVSEDGAAHIYNGEISAKLNAFLKAVDEYQVVKALSDAIDQELQDACEQDERLKQLMELLYGPNTD